MDGRTEREEFAQLTTSLTSMLTNLCRVVLAGHTAIAPDHPSHFRTGSNGQHRRHPMTFALALAKLADSSQTPSQRSQLPQRQLTARRESLFISLQRRGQLRSPKPFSRLRMQQTHPQLFGSR